MLSTLRHKGVAKKVLWFVTAIIVLSFGFFGVASNVDNNINSAGTLYGKNVSIKDFQKAYLSARDQAIILYQDRFFTLGDRLDLEREAWDRLILLKEAKKQNIKVSNEELVSLIASIPFFQRDGKFDKNLYTSIVTNQRIFGRRLPEFEDGMRDQLMIKKLLDQVAPASEISEEELKREFQRRHEKIKLSYVLFGPENYLKDVSATDEEIKKYYEERKEQFRTPPMIDLSYVHLTYPDKATDAQKEEIKKKAQAISSELNPGADFQAVTKKHGVEVKTSGFFTLDQPLLTFASSPEDLEKFFAMKVNEFSQPLEVPDGWQIVQIKDKKPSAVPSWEEAKEKSKGALLMQKAFDVARVKADEALKQIQDAIKSKEFKKAAGELNLKVEETPVFGRGEYIANVGLVQEFQQEALTLTLENRLSNIVPTSAGPAILHLDSATPVDDEQYKADKENFRDMLSAEKRNQTLIAFMTKLRMSAQVKSKIKQR